MLEAGSSFWRANIISVLNLVTLIALLLTAIATWYGGLSEIRTTRVTLELQLEAAAKQLEAVRTQVTEASADRKSDLSMLRAKDEFLTDTIRNVQDNVGHRLSSIETKVEVQGAILKSIEDKVKGLKDGH